MFGAVAPLLLEPAGGGAAGRLRGARGELCRAPLREAATAAALRELWAGWEARRESWLRTSWRDFTQLQAAAGLAGSRWGGAGRAAAGGPQDAGSSEQQEAGGRARLVGPRQGGAVW